jgi:2-oxoisovalerate dehydrogenase E1 component
MPNVLESLNHALHEAFSANENVYLLGEDVLDPYGGAFKVTRGLSTSYPERVLTTPISEAGFVGMATGMSLRGLRPIVEIMFGDFITLAADQIINHLTKFRWMYNDQVRLPLVIRTPMGGRRGYGPTHSQTLEKIFLGVPGLTVIAPAALSLTDGSDSPGELLYRSILECDDPILFIENKLQYPQPVKTQHDSKDFSISTVYRDRERIFPTYVLSILGSPHATITLTAYGYMAELATQAILKLAYEHELFAELVIPTQLSPLDIDPIITSVGRTGALLTIEEGTLSSGWGAEVIARSAESLGIGKIKYKRLAAKELPVPCSGLLEEDILPSEEDITQAVLQLQHPSSF